MAPGQREPGVQPGAPRQLLVLGRGGRHEGAQAQGLTALLSDTGRAGSGPPPRTPLAWETGGPGSERAGGGPPWPP